jgi:hypothetical protein
MILLVYATLFVGGMATLLGVLSGIVPETIGSLWALVIWAALVPGSFAVEIGAQSGSLSTVTQPTLAFVAVAGIGMSGLVLFADVTGRLTRGDAQVAER